MEYHAMNNLNIGTIGSTKDYKLFHALDGNRIVKHRADLINSMKLHGFDKNQPIKVFSDGAIADGQHRLSTALQLGIEVFYQVIEEPKGETRLQYIQRINTASKNWSSLDYLHSRANDSAICNDLEQLKIKYVDDKTNPNAIPYTVLQVCAGLSGNGNLMQLKNLEEKLLDRETTENNILFIAKFIPFIKTDARIYAKGLITIKAADQISENEEKLLYKWFKEHKYVLPAVSSNVTTAMQYLTTHFNDGRRRFQINWLEKYSLSQAILKQKESKE